jgi:isopentenyl-diphosphate delta-isomerase
MTSVNTTPSETTISVALDTDPTAVSRKHDHIELAFQSQVGAALLDDRFFYEPLLAAHPQPGSLPAIPFLGTSLRAPLWVSSMTGGTALARTINRNLARACAEFGMGMGLGSCRWPSHTYLQGPHNRDSCRAENRRHAFPSHFQFVCHRSGR